MMTHEWYWKFVSATPLRPDPKSTRLAAPPPPGQGALPSAGAGNGLVDLPKKGPTSRSTPWVGPLSPRPDSQPVVSMARLPERHLPVGNDRRLARRKGRRETRARQKGAKRSQTKGQHRIYMAEITRHTLDSTWLIIVNKLLPAAELQIQKRKLKQRPTNRLQPQPQNVLMYVTKNIFRI